MWRVLSMLPFCKWLLDRLNKREGNQQAFHTLLLPMTTCFQVQINKYMQYLKKGKKRNIIPLFVCFNNILLIQLKKGQHNTCRVYVKSGPSEDKFGVSLCFRNPNDEKTNSIRSISPTLIRKNCRSVIVSINSGGIHLLSMCVRQWELEDSVV